MLLLLLLLLKYGDPGTVGPWIKGNLPSSPPIMVVLRQPRVPSFVVIHCGILKWGLRYFWHSPVQT